MSGLVVHPPTKHSAQRSASPECNSFLPYPFSTPTNRHQTCLRALIFPNRPNYLSLKEHRHQYQM
ncbi:hypothetical protein BC830DRAFT_1133344 [Chytriomyces sp. MP71]|nr:hypothetical protein BC830DRAFT_1133344 [Chytriomyces sp. MP71]